LDRLAAAASRPGDVVAVGACAVIEEGVAASTSSTPPLVARSSSITAESMSQTARVRSVGPVRNSASPS